MPPLFASTCNPSGVYLTNHKFTWLHPRPALALQRELHNKAPRPEVDDAQYRCYRDWFEDGRDHDQTEEQREEALAAAELRVHNAAAATWCSA